MFRIHGEASDERMMLVRWHVGGEVPTSRTRTFANVQGEGVRPRARRPVPARLADARCPALGAWLAHAVPGAERIRSGRKRPGSRGLEEAVPRRRSPTRRDAPR